MEPRPLNGFITVGAAVQQGADLLDRGGITVPRLTAEVLLSHALHRDRAYLHAHPERELREVEWIHFGRYLHERLRRKPTQYITGVQEFYGRSFNVTSSVLIPRPETEHLVEHAIPIARESRIIVDVGTGSGAIAITLSLETGCVVVATDVSAEALAVARRNSIDLGAGVTLMLADSLTAFAPQSIDLVTSNPPYINALESAALQPEVRDWEPPLALYAEGGLSFYRRLIAEATEVVRPGGSLVVELGAGQAADVSAMLDARWTAPQVTPDLAGIPRVLATTRTCRALQ